MASAISITPLGGGDIPETAGTTATGNRAVSDENSVDMVTATATFGVEEEEGSVQSQSSSSPSQEHSLLRTPQPIVTIKVKGGNVFYVHKPLLVKDSEYFHGALNGKFLEGKTQTIELDDITSDDFGQYNDLLYRAYLGGDNFRLRASLAHSLVTYMLADRFLNANMVRVARESVLYRTRAFSVATWARSYSNALAGKKPHQHPLRSWVEKLQQAWVYCGTHRLPFQDEIATACANCPPQVYADAVELLESDFMAVVSKKLAMRHANPSLKRYVEDLQEPKEPKRRRHRRKPATAQP